MKIWIVEIGEPLPFEDNVRLHRYGMFTKYLAKAGHDVTWWTSTFSHAPKKNLKDADCQLEIDKVRLKLIHGPGYKRNVSVSRIIHLKRFARSFLKMSAGAEKPDLIICPLPTLDNIKAVYAYSKKTDIPYIIDIRDAWPDELVNLFPKPFRLILKLLLVNTYRTTRTVCKNAKGLMSSSRNLLEYGLSFAGRTQRETDHVFYHGYSAIVPADDELTEARQFWADQDIEADSVKICYFGTMGALSDSATVIQAIKRVRKESKFQLILCGHGPLHDTYQSMTKGHTDYIKMPGWIDAPKIWTLMEMSHAGIIPYVSNSNMSLPNKPFEYFAGRIPVITSIQKELKEIIEEHNCGYVYYDEKNVDALCEIFHQIRNNPEDAAEKGRNGRALLEAKYSHDRVFQAAENHLGKLMQNLP